MKNTTLVSFEGSVSVFVSGRSRVRFPLGASNVLKSCFLLVISSDIFVNPFHYVYHFELGQNNCFYLFSKQKTKVVQTNNTFL
jgi:hypothetical protein